MRRGGLRPALYAYGRAHRARDPCARRPSPSPAHKGRGHGRRGPRPLSPKGDAGPPPASASAPPPHGGHPAARPPKGGHGSAGRAHSARILPPPMRLGLLCVSGASPISPPPPPPPRPLGRGGARGHDRLRAGTWAAHICPRPSTSPPPAPSAVGRARHTRGRGFLRVATHTRLTNRSVSGKILLRGHTGSVRSAALHVHGATKPPVFDGGLLLYLRP